MGIFGKKKDKIEEPLLPQQYPQYPQYPQQQQYPAVVRSSVMDNTSFPVEQPQQPQKSQEEEIVDTINKVVEYMKNHEARLKKIEKKAVFTGLSD